MTLEQGSWSRRSALRLSLGGLAVLALPAFARDAWADGGIKSLLGRASDGALDKLAQPGAFYADKAVRLMLPGPLKDASRILKYTSKMGLTKDLQRSMNDAAGLAAKEAKPVFRAAIDDLTLTDGVGILTGGKTGGTDYLRRTSGEVLGERLRPADASCAGRGRGLSTSWTGWVRCPRSPGWQALISAMTG